MGNSDFRNHFFLHVFIFNFIAAGETTTFSRHIRVHAPTVTVTSSDGEFRVKTIVRPCLTSGRRYTTLFVYGGVGHVRRGGGGLLATNWRGDDVRTGRTSGRRCRRATCDGDTSVVYAAECCCCCCCCCGAVHSAVRGRSETGGYRP